MMKAMFAKFSSGLSVGKSASKDLFDFMACFQLMGEKTPEGEAARKIGFRAADPNGNGLCSLAELETFVLSTLLAKYPKDAKTKVEKGKNLWELFRPSYIKAFTDAKDYKKDDGDVISGTKSATADDFVSKGEFRLFCAYLCIYASMYDAFSKIDGGGEGRGGDDRKIDMAEWMAKDAGYKGVKEHGFIGLASIKDAASAKLVFEAMDDNGGGVLMLDEWCDYLKKKEIEAGTKLGETLNEEEVGGAAAGGGGGGGAAAESGSSSKKGKAAQRPTKVYSSGLIVGADASKELFDFMDLFHPMAEKSPEAEKLREEGFVTADPNGNGLCSLAELETFVLKSLVTKFPKTGKGNAMMEPGKDLFDAFRPCYIRAFTDAKDYEADTGEKIEGTKKATADDFVSKKEFRLFCAYLCVYAAMFDAFAKVDGGGAGRDASDDRRIDLKEMEKGYKGIGGFGFVAFKDLKSKADATAVFRSIDDNGGGIVLLDEWCLFIKNAEIKAGTTLGAILNEDEAGGVGKEYTLASAKGPSIVPGRVSAKAVKKSSSKDTDKDGAASPAAVDAKPKKPPKVYSSGLEVGPAASKELFDFMDLFHPMAEKSPEAEKLREEGFVTADPNGNGLCSLAELETFVLKSLVTKFPKTGKGNAMMEPGKDLFDAFRPCYIRAFTDAKDYEKDTGEKIEGTKKATADDFVSKKEFRLFCAYLCVYAAMFDAFAKVDGGGAGRDASDDRRIDLAEMEKGYKGIGGFGFVAFKDLKSKADATAVFKSIDDNGGGIVLLDEWCLFIKNAEIKAGTTLGAILNEDEAGGVGKEYTLASAKGPSIVPGRVSAKALKRGSSKASDKGDKGEAASPAAADAKPKKPPKVYSSGLEVGPDASKDLFNFMDLFHPMAEKSPEAEKLREEGFVTADPNGNGLCSLAELETFVLKSLVTKFPKTGKGNAMMEPGKDLFDAFRPCYIRAFTDAKDYEKDTGEKIEGTKKATADDFVSKKEFRLFCAYLCVYAAMFDAFAKVDGGGAGRDASDDRRIDLAEMEKGYKGIGGFGFVAFKDLNTKADATAVFKSIDDNGGGIVLLDEWCLFIKNAEIKAGTTLGAILNEDEAGGVGKEYTLASAKGPSIKVGRVSASKGTPKALAKSKSRDISPGAKSTTSNKSKSSASSKKKGAADDGSKI